MPPAVTAVLQQVQMDHTSMGLIVVDERHRLPIDVIELRAGK
jgi:putative transposase